MTEGKLIHNGVILQPHEMATVIFLLDLGLNIELIPRSNKAGVRTPDIRMLGLCWEMKNPKGEGKWLIKNIMQKASHQSENIIIDLRRSKIYKLKCLREIEKYFKLSKRIRRVRVIVNAREVVDFVK